MQAALSRELLILMTMPEGPDLLWLLSFLAADCMLQKVGVAMSWWPSGKA
jgi:hypothetical protein